VVIIVKLKAAQLKALPEDQFGLPKARKYPMPDKAHVIKAIQFFGYAKPDERKELARNINRRAKELGVKLNPHGEFAKYASRDIVDLEAYNIGTLEPIVAGNEPLLTGIRIPGADDDVPPEDKFLGLIASDQISMKHTDDLMEACKWALPDNLISKLKAAKMSDDHTVRYGDIYAEPTKTFNDFDKYVTNCVLYKEHKDMLTYMTTPMLYSYFDRLKWSRGSGCDTIDHELSYVSGTKINRELPEDEIATKMKKLFPIYSDPAAGKAEKIAYFTKIFHHPFVNKDLAIKHIMNCIRTNSCSPIDILFAKQTEMPDYKIEAPKTLNIPNDVINQISTLVTNIDISEFYAIISMAMPDSMNMQAMAAASTEFLLFWGNFLISRNYKGYAIIGSGTDQYLITRESDYADYQVSFILRDKKDPTEIQVVGIKMLKDSVEGDLIKLIKARSFSTPEVWEAMCKGFVWGSGGCTVTYLRMNPGKQKVQEASFVNGRRIIDAVKGMKIKDNGDVTVDLKDKLSFEHYNQVHRVAMSNIKENNVVAMKENAAYIFSIISRIENDYTFNRMMDKKSSQYREMIRLRALFINDFKLLIKAIMKEERDFRFMDYYVESGYDDSVHTIDHRVIKSLGLVFAKIMAV
jgi:hypothetical protein